MKMDAEVNALEPKIRFNVKETSKREKYFEFTVRGNTIEEIKNLTSEVSTYIEQITTQTKVEVSNGTEPKN
jgi:hypothetical protein